MRGILEDTPMRLWAIYCPTEDRWLGLGGLSDMALRAVAPAIDTLWGDAVGNVYGYDVPIVRGGTVFRAYLPDPDGRDLPDTDALLFSSQTLATRVANWLEHGRVGETCPATVIPVTP